MAAFRQHLRLLSAAWIVFQVTSLSTLVPRACCMAHQAKPADCHDQAPVQDSATQSASGSMHGHEHMHQQTAPAPANSAPAHDCALRGTCGGPAAALLALLSTDGVLAEPIASPGDSLLAVATRSAADQLIPQFESPDAPPPRA